MQQAAAIRAQLRLIYGARGEAAYRRIAALLEGRGVSGRLPSGRFSEQDVVLIAYADLLRSDGEAPLQTLHDFASRRLRDEVSAIHLLPFFPYSSDDGFAVKDYFRVDPSLGTWDDVVRLGEDFDLMFDFVLNHLSSGSAWFTHYLQDRPGFTDLAIEVPPGTDLSAVTRPRTDPLLTAFTKASGEQVHLWTTFSADQVDLNYGSIEVLSRMVEALLFYVDHGAKFIRMDAVGYIWKEIGTGCIHLPQAHALVRLFRLILDAVAPEVLIVTETNVPHQENISYFGNGGDEAQLVYNFTLPPMLLHTFVAGDAQPLAQWAAGLSTPSAQTAFLNFTASHDGIGVRPLEGLLRRAQIDRLIRHTLGCGGSVSSRRNPDGSSSPYELNITYVDPMAADGQWHTPVHAARFLASQAIALALPGVPAVYLHSLLGSGNWMEGVVCTGRVRSINRERLDTEALSVELKAACSFRYRIFSAYCDLLKIRRRQPAFHPKAAFEVLPLGQRMFGIVRRGGGQAIYAVTSIYPEPLSVDLPAPGTGRERTDLLSGEVMTGGRVRFGPYQSRWLSSAAP